MKNALVRTAVTLAPARGRHRRDMPLDTHMARSLTVTLMLGASLAAVVLGVVGGVV